MGYGFIGDNMGLWEFNYGLIIDEWLWPHDMGWSWDNTGILVDIASDNLITIDCW